MAIFEDIGRFLGTWWFALLVVIVLSLASSPFLRYESPSDKRDRLREERRIQRKQKKKDSDDDILQSLLNRSNPKSVELSSNSAENSTGAPLIDRHTAPVQNNTEVPLRWTQNNEEIEIFLTVPRVVGKSDIGFQLTANNWISISIKGQELINGELFRPVDKDASSWQIEDQKENRVIWIQLPKSGPNKNESWTALLKRKDS